MAATNFYKATNNLINKKVYVTKGTIYENVSGLVTPYDSLHKDGGDSIVILDDRGRYVEVDKGDIFVEDNSAEDFAEMFG